MKPRKRGRPAEDRVRRTVHITKPTDKELKSQAKTAGTLGKVIDEWAKKTKPNP